MRDPKIKSGSELDWEMVRKAAKGIMRAADNAGFRPPEDITGHIILVKDVCFAMDSIVDALKLRQANAHEMTGTDSCDLMNSPHPHADGFAWVKCSCGWRSHPVKERDAATIFSAHVTHALNQALLDAAKHGKALAEG